MTEILLTKQNIHSGDLILVNRRYGCVCDETAPLVPVVEQMPDILMQSRAVNLLLNLMDKIQGWRSIVPVSGWRSHKEQQEIWNGSLEESGLEFTEKFVAVPGHSEHQTGLAIDLALKQEEIDFICPEFPYYGICQVFREQAAQFGFVERYPAGKESVTGIGHEPWHFRYVGAPHAAIMTEREMVLEEYLDYLKQFPYGVRTLFYETNQRKFEISYLQASDAPKTRIQIEENVPYLISGNNMDGYIVTLWKNML